MACSAPEPLVLVAEDEPLAALELAAILTDAGMRVVGPAPSLADAIALAEHPGLAVAVLDVNLRGERVFPLVDLLTGRGIAVVLVTGYEVDAALPEAYRSIASLQKPVDRHQLIEIVRQILAALAATDSPPSVSPAGRRRGDHDD